MTARNEFDGTPISDILATTSTVVDGLFTVNGTNATIVEFDNSGSSDKWTSVKLALTFALSVGAAVGKTIDIYRWETSVDGVGGHDELAPTTTLKKGAKFVGSFSVPSASTDTLYLSALVSLVGVKKCKFALYNGTGQTLASGATLDIEGAGFNDS
jgi:hypothetical protein